MTQITVTLPDELARRLEVMPDPERFVVEVVQEALGGKQQKPRATKWARLTERIDRDSPGLGDYTEQFKRDMQEVREGVEFGEDG